jgi:hypothetical protein
MNDEREQRPDFGPDEADPAGPPPSEPPTDTNPAHGSDDKEAYAGRPDQDIKHTLGPGAGGATEWGGGNKNSPVRRNSNVRQGGG